MFALHQLRLPLLGRFLAGWAFAALQANAAVPEQALPDAWRLQEVTQIALRNRAEVAAANARAEALEQRPAIVAALEDPMVSPSIDHYPFDMPKEEGEMGEAGGGRRYDWSVSVEQRFPLSGVRGHRKAAAQADAHRARALAYGTGLDVVLEAQRSFFMLIERRRMQRVFEEQLILAKQVVSASSSRYANGVGSQADVLRAEVEVARMQASQQALAAQIRANEAMLNASLGRAPQERIPELVHVPSRDLPLPAETAIEQALLRRPELVAGEAEIKRAAAETAVMRSMYKPMAMIRVGRATTMAEGPGAMIMIGISVPIWRDRLRAGVAEARAMQRMADADLSAMRLMVESEAAASRETVATVVADESRITHVHVRVSGWLEELYINTTGQTVRAGQPLAGVFSQELYSSQQEYLSALRRVGPASAVLDAARTRLEVLGMGRAEIERLERTGEARRLVTIVAPRSGIVLNRGVSAGTAVDPSTELVTIADLSAVWVIAEVAEADAAQLRTGATAMLSFPMAGRVPFSAKVEFIYPTLTERTRSVRVRLPVQNKDGTLRPGMYGGAEFPAIAREALTVPRDAVVDTGQSQHVFVHTTENVIEPRTVKVGARQADRIEILQGLTPGDHVVTTGVFLIDSESRLRASGSTGHSGHGGDKTPAPERGLNVESDATAAHAHRP